MLPIVAVTLAWAGCSDSAPAPGDPDTDQRGTMITGSEVELADDGLFPDVAFSGTEYGVVYVAQGPAENRDLRFVRVNADGEPIAGSNRSMGVAGRPEGPTVVWNAADRQWALFWEDHSDDGVHFARLTENGEMIPGSTIDFGQGQTHYNGALLWTGTHYAMAWAEFRAARLAIVGRDGTIEATFSRPTDAQPFHVAAVWTGERFGLTWDMADDLVFRGHFIEVDVDGNEVAGTFLRWGNGTDHVVLPSPLWDRRMLVFWEEREHLWMGKIEDGAFAEVIDLTPSRMLGGISNPVPLWNGCHPVIAYAAPTSGNLMLLPYPSPQID